jgi:hypothetical protein
MWWLWFCGVLRPESHFIALQWSIWPWLPIIWLRWPKVIIEMNTFNVRITGTDIRKVWVLQFVWKVLSHRTYTDGEHGMSKRCINYYHFKETKLCSQLSTVYSVM